MYEKQYPQFLLVGDSHIQYASRLRDGFAFSAGLAEHVERRLDIINRGFSGYNTSHLLNILENIVPSTSSAKVDYVVSSFEFRIDLHFSVTSSHLGFPRTALRSPSHKTTLLFVISYVETKYASPFQMLND
jgi:hypothetical protein